MPKWTRHQTAVDSLAVDRPDEPTSSFIPGLFSGELRRLFSLRHRLCIHMVPSHWQLDQRAVIITVTKDHNHAHLTHLSCQVATFGIMVSHSKALASYYYLDRVIIAVSARLKRERVPPVALFSEPTLKAPPTPSGMICSLACMTLDV
jgi:hypothetical protein